MGIVFGERLAIATRAWYRHGVCFSGLGPGIVAGQFCGFPGWALIDADVGDFAGIDFLRFGRSIGDAGTVARFVAIGSLGEIGMAGGLGIVEVLARRGVPD